VNQRIRMKVHRTAVNQKSALICVHLRLMKLKKQSQFVGGRICTKSYLKGLYDNFLACAARKNKPNQSQFPQNFLQPATEPDRRTGVE